MLIQFAARNILRHRARSLMTIAAIASGVAALIVSGGFVQDLYRQLGEAIIHSQSGHLQVGQPAFFAEGSRSPEKNRITDLPAVKAELSRMPGVKRVMARLSFAGLINNRRSDLPIVGEGIEPREEADLATAVQILSGHALGAEEGSGALIGEGLAKALGLAPGDPFTLVATTVDGAMNTADLEVAGVFRSFSKDYDARAVKIPLPVAQDLMGTRDANTVVVLLQDTSRTTVAQAAATELMRPHGLIVKNWRELNDFYGNTVQLYDRQFGVLNVIILFMVALGASNAVNMAVFERFGEFGTMRALGNRGRHVTLLVIVECALLGIIGACVGAAGGALLAMLISAVGIPMPPPPNSNIGYTAQIELLPRLIAEAFAIGVIATVLAGLIPAFRARRIPIVDALRHGV